MYSPFIDENGKPVGIEQIQFEHLMMLKTCDEGYHIDYKSQLDDGGKNNIAKLISAFSNCEGGWIFVGVDDNKKFCYVENCDYSQKIGKITSRVSPMPEFETKFIPSPDDNNKGILVIYVYEGRNAPYICEGSIYVRCGSSKEPIKPADRGNVEYLLQRTKDYQKQLDDFFCRDYYFSINHQTSLKEIKYPFISVYLKNISHKKALRLENYQNRKEFVEYMKNKKYTYAQYALNSIVCMREYIYPGQGGTFVFELFYDFSCKIYMPLGISDKKEIEEIKKLFVNMGAPFLDVDCYHMFNAGMVCNHLLYSLWCFADIAKEYGLNEKDYVLCVESENIGNFIMCFSGEKYKEYIKEHGGIPYAVNDNSKSRYIYLKEYEGTCFEDLPQIVLQDAIAPFFGYESDAIHDLLEDDNKKYS